MGQWLYCNDTNYANLNFQIILKLATCIAKHSWCLKMCIVDYLTDSCQRPRTLAKVSQHSGDR